MTTAAQPIVEVLEAYKAAVYARDVDAFAALYDDDIQVFDMWGAWSYRGLAAWRGMATGWFESLGSERVGVDFDEVTAEVARDMAFAHAFVTFRGLSAEGKELRSLQNRLTMTLRQKNGRWKIVHEHTSGPIDFETGKVMLKRTDSGAGNA